MNSTLILYENHSNYTKEILNKISTIISNSKVQEVSEKNNNTDNYSNILIAICVYDENQFNLYESLKEYNIDFKDKKLVIVCIGSPKEDVNQYISTIQEITNKSDLYYYFIDISNNKNENITKAAINIKKYIEKPKKRLPKEQLKKYIGEYIKENNTLVLATGKEDFVRATPIEYIYYKNKFYMITEGGLKFVGIYENRNVSMGIYKDYKNMNDIQGMQITGTCEIIKKDSEEYKEILNVKGINIENLEKLPVTMNMIKVKPTKYEFIDSKFKKMGYDVKQILRV